MSYLNLVRYKNLIFIFCLQYLMRYLVIKPWLQTFGMDSFLNNYLFFLLALGSTLIAAGGYVINDYYDTKIDALNRPEKVIVGNAISLKQASLTHQILTIAGFLCGLVVALFLKNLTIGLVFILVPGLLWFYSASYKRQFLIGNFIVAFCAALLILLVVVAENASLVNEFGYLLAQTPVSQILYTWIGGFALFAFLITLIREIIKDMEDEYGDRELECRTMPVVWGFKKSKIVLYGLISVTLAILALFTFQFIQFENDTLTTRYFIFGCLLPFIYLVYLIIKAKTPSDFHAASSFTKYIMIIGSLYSVVLYFLLARTFGIVIFNLFKLQ